MIQVTIGEGVAEQVLSAPIIAACINAGVAIITGSVVGFIAWRQWNTAKDKLALDLFDRRFAAFKAFGDEVSNVMAGIIENVKAAKAANSAIPYWGFSQLWTTHRELYFLFGQEVLDIASDTTTSLQTFYKSLQADGSAEERDQIGREVVNNQARLLKAVEPYMMMNKIAVNRPSKAKRG